MSSPSLPLRASRRSLLALAGLGAGAGLLAACGGGSSSGASDGGGDDAVTVVAGCYPMEYLADVLAGDHIAVTQLAAPGVDAHGIELSVKQVMEIEEAGLVIWIPGLQTALDDAVSSDSSDNVLDVTESIEMLGSSGDAHDDHDHDMAGSDPHVWTDPLRMADMGDAIAERLTALLPDAAEEISANAQTLRSDLEALDADLQEKLGTGEGTHTFITSHTAFGYLADRYGLEQVGIAGVDPEVEPSPQRLLQLEQVVQDEGVSTVFFETTASPKVAQTLAKNVGVEAEELDNLETQLDPDVDYVAAMRSNAEKLAASWS